MPIDDPVFGEASLTRDTETGLDWLDLTITANQSYKSIQSQLSSTYLGFRYATTAELAQLRLNVGFSGFAFNLGTAENYMPAQNLLDLFGRLDIRTGNIVLPITYAASIGLPHLDDFQYVEYQFGASQGFFGWFELNQLPITYPEDIEINPQEQASPRIGSFLVRESMETTTIPEPTSMLLLASGLIGAYFRRGKYRP